MTDELIDRLASEAKPVARGALSRWLLLGLFFGAALAAIGLFAIGLRPDLATAWADPIFWTKFGYTLLLALAGYVAVERLARPGGSLRRAGLAAAAIVLAGALAGIVQLALAPPEAVRALVLGGTALVCPFYIVALSLPVFAATVLAMRRLAPTNLMLAGAAAGLLAGGTGAWVYAFHCGENGLAFLAIWYTLGIAAVTAIGALLGRYVLRW